MTPWDYQSKRCFSLDGPMATLPSGERSGQNQQAVFVPIAFAQNQREEVRDLRGVAVALNAEPGTHQQTYVIVPQHSECCREVLPFDTTQVTSPRNGNNPKWGDACHPIAAQGHPPTVICKKTQYLFENHGQDSRYKGPLDVCPMLPAQLGTGGNNTPFVAVENKYFALQSFGQHKEQDVSTSIKARDNKGSNDLVVEKFDVPFIRYIVRRLTPTECARLQGFADRWGDIDPKEDFTDEEYRFWLDVRNTHAAINGKTVKEHTKAQMLTWYNKLHTDSAEYKMWGNGIALPPALYVMQGITDVFCGGK